MATIAQRLTVHALQADDTYTVTTTSPSFPDLPLFEIERFMHERHGKSETEWIRSFRDWVVRQYGK